MTSAMQAWIETADRAQNVNARELFGFRALFEQRGIHYRAFAGAGDTERVARRSHPGRSREDLIISDPSLFDRDMVSHCPSNALPEPNPDGFDGQAEMS